VRWVFRFAIGVVPFEIRNWTGGRLTIADYKIIAFVGEGNQRMMEESRSETKD
jgi:hypothetical protein